MARKSGYRFSDKAMLKRKRDGSDSTQLDQTSSGE